MKELFSSAALIAFIYFNILFAMAYRLKNYAIADIGWGLGFIIINCFALTFTVSFNPLTTIVTALIFLWGARLTIYIFMRNHNKPEDFRYREMREKWGKSAVWQVYVKLYLTQAAVMCLVSIPILISSIIEPVSQWPIWIFGATAFFGFAYESISDYQLAKFKANPANRGTIMSTGLWRFSRHPNYFGEIIFWWSISLLAALSTGNYLALTGGLIMNWLLIYVSGVPMLEAKYQSNPDYRRYVKETNAILPWRRIKSS